MNWCHFFFRLTEYPDLSWKVFLITFKSSALDNSAVFCNSSANKAAYSLFSFMYREITTVETLFFSLKVLKAKKKLALTLFYYVFQEIWLGNLKKLICINQSTFSYNRENSKMFNITSKYFSIFSNKSPASWVAHITRKLFTFYSCSYYSSIIRCKKWKAISYGSIDPYYTLFWGHVSVDSGPFSN